MKKTFFWLLGGAAAIYLFSKLSFRNKANFLLKGVSVGGSVLSPRIKTLIAIQNPTNNKMTLKSLSGALYVNDKYLANVSSFGDQVILPNSENVIELTARPSAIGIFNSVKELLTTPTGNIKASFNGSGNIDGFNIPFNETITI